jgi:hypothetical protein
MVGIECSPLMEKSVRGLLPFEKHWGNTLDIDGRYEARQW